MFSVYRFEQSKQREGNALDTLFANSVTVDEKYVNDMNYAGKKVLKRPPSAPITARTEKQTKWGTLDTQKTQSLHNHLRRTNQLDSSNTGQVITKHMLQSTIATNAVLDMCDYTDEEKSTLLLLSELERKKYTKVQRKSMVPAQPVSYTRKPQENQKKKHQQRVENEANGITTHYPSNVDGTMEEFDEYGLPGSRYDDLQAASTFRSTTSSAATRSRPVRARSVCHTSRSSQSNVNTLMNHIKLKSSTTAQALPLQLSGEGGEPIDALMYDIAQEYKDSVLDPSKRKREQEKRQNQLQRQYQGVYPLVTKHFVKYFANRNFGFGEDARVDKLNQQIEQTALEEAIRDRVEKDHVDYLEKKLKVNQQRKMFKNQRQKNFLKSVVSNDPRVIRQLNDAVSNAIVVDDDIPDDTNYGIYDDDDDQPSYSYGADISYDRPSTAASPSVVPRISNWNLDTMSEKPRPQSASTIRSTILYEDHKKPVQMKFKTLFSQGDRYGVIPPGAQQVEEQQRIVMLEHNRLQNTFSQQSQARPKKRRESVTSIPVRKGFIMLDDGMYPARETARAKFLGDSPADVPTSNLKEIDEFETRLRAYSVERICE
jgi:hypothetical protein